ncbi:hypothetical protein Scel_60790 [Streptomyces cellostaticus]|nr:hypothetical protein Scel_60790 [Streptomyces cellostaticus]
MGSAPGRGFVSGAGWAVEANDRMHVDGCTPLVLGNAGEGQPGMPGEAGLHQADRRGEAPPDVDDETVPELGRVYMPQDVGGVVVAVGAERLAGTQYIRCVDEAAAEGAPMFARAAVAAGTARLR